jgi:hypothetical protein
MLTKNIAAVRSPSMALHDRSSESLVHAIAALPERHVSNFSPCASHALVVAATHFFSPDEKNGVPFFAIRRAFSAVLQVVR